MPFSRNAVPMLAVAWTTALTAGEFPGGVTRNVAATARPGRTVAEHGPADRHRAPALRHLERQPDRVQRLAAARHAASPGR